MITPTIGRVIWFRPIEEVSQPWPAFVTFVHDNTLINVAGFRDNGAVFSESKVTLLQDGATPPTGSPYAEWMPYQVAQAATQPPATPTVQPATSQPGQPGQPTA